MTGSGTFTPRQSFLAALRYPAYRYLWGSAVAMGAASSIEMLAVGWLVLEITDSPSMVGLVAALRWVGMGFGPFFGILADRFDRRHTIIVLRLAGSGYALALAVLYFTSLLAAWQIFILVLIGGTLNAYDFTTSNTIVPDTTESQNLSSAVGLMMSGVSISRMVGPLVGGYLFDRLGAGGTFSTIAVLYLVTSAIITPMRIAGRPRLSHPEPIWRSLTGGVRQVVSDRTLLALIIMAAVANLFVFPVVFGIMPVFVRDVLHAEASGLGQLMAIEGLGGLIGALAIMALGKSRHKGSLVFLTLVTWAVFLGIFSGSRLFPVSLMLLAGAGLGRGLTFGMIQLLLLTWAPEEIRGRVMGLRIFAVVTMPLGSILMGVGADLWGVATVILVSTMSCILVTALFAFLIPELRRRQ